jgi:hypothetical protein
MKCFNSVHRQNEKAVVPKRIYSEVNLFVEVQSLEDMLAAYKNITT